MAVVGVLALQGSFNEHIAALRRLGVKGVEIRKPEQLDSVASLIIPGGESTTMAKLAQYHNLFPALREFVTMGKPVWGTCAGLIFLANNATGQKRGGQELIGGLDCTVNRNFFGSQIQSFEAELSVPELASKEGGPETFRGVFIRAPAILEVGPEVQVLAECPVPSNKVLASRSEVEDQEADGNDDGNSNNNNGNNDNNNKNNGNNDDDDNGNNNSSNNGNGNNNNQEDDPATTDYDELAPAKTGQQRAMCKAKGACKSKTLMCPSQCPERKPKNNKKMKKGCFVDCSSKCEVTCKYRKPNCNGYGSLCYDPRFVGGDGVMFYFHGAKGGNFAIVSDDDLQINAYFIGTRPRGRTRDFTWVQALAVMFDTHTLVIAAKRVTHWDDNVDALSVRWDGEAVNIANNGEGEWRTNGEEREVVVERTDDANSVRVTVAHLVEIDIRVTPIGQKENKVHNYQIPADDAFAHLETQFRFAKLTDFVEGVLGKTYRPDYVSPVKIGVPMPMMGGEDKYQTPSLYSPICKACRFQRQPAIGSMKEVAQY